MILFTVLLVMLLLLAAFAVILLSVGGTAFVIVFGDVIVCIALIVWLIRFLVKKKKEK